jgi:hypothetical protein
MPLPQAGGRIGTARWLPFTLVHLGRISFFSGSCARMLALDGLNRPDEMVGVEEPAPVEEEELAAAVEVPQAAGSEESSCAAPPCVDFEDLPHPQTVAGEGASATSLPP